MIPQRQPLSLPSDRLIRFTVLGPVRVSRGGETVAVRWPMARSVLAALLLNANRIVPVDSLVDVVWGDMPPTTAVASLHNHVMRLRALLGEGAAGRIQTAAPGYRIQVAGGELDLDEFGQLDRAGRSALDAGDWTGAARELAAALDLWRGLPLEDVTSGPLRARYVPQLAQRRLEAVEGRIDAQLRLGQHDDLIPELTGLVAAHPLQERFHAQLMLAHVGAGRPAAALGVFAQAREVLAEELGTDPGPGLRALHQQILRDDLPSRTVPWRAGTIRPAQLPSDAGSFTGRTREIAVLAGLAEDDQGRDPGSVSLCLVSGPGGIGKTALAVHAAHQIRAQFPDGQLYAHLGGLTTQPAPPVKVLGAFLRDLGAPARQIPNDELGRAALLRSMLADRRALIVLDDARDSAQVMPLLPGTAGCAVIVTSRNALAELPTRCRVSLGPLDTGQGLELMAGILGPDCVSAEVKAAVRLVDLCAGLPLALRIAGARLAARRHWRIRELVDRLANPATRLDELVAGSLSVRSSLALGYAALPAGPIGSMPAQAFRLLGLLGGLDISLQAAAALLNTDAGTAENILEGLVDRHLLEAASAPRRYRFPNLVGLYAAERARAEECPAEIRTAMGRLLGCYIHNAAAADQVLTLAPEPARPPDACAQGVGRACAGAASCAGFLGTRRCSPWCPSGAHGSSARSGRSRSRHHW